MNQATNCISISALFTHLTKFKILSIHQKSDAIFSTRVTTAVEQVQHELVGNLDGKSFQHGLEFRDGELSVLIPVQHIESHA